MSDDQKRLARFGKRKAVSPESQQINQEVGAELEASDQGAA
jgi:hypothetical protein